MMSSFYNNSEMEETDMAKKPVHEIRLGRIRAAIWENETQNGTLHNVTFSRLYKDEEDQWADSASFGRDDLPLLAKVADMVHTWIFQKATDKNGSSEEPERSPKGKRDAAKSGQKDNF
jgi:hypothetical protein